MNERRSGNQVLIAVIEERLDNLKSANNIDHQLIIQKIDQVNGIKADIKWLTWAVRSIIVTMIGFSIWLIELSIKK